uniref:Uncharacterized protein n=1 Tax=Salix viminalis TaxID=40686 RepID=A0A6N2NID3_SALVM
MPGVINENWIEETGLRPCRYESAISIPSLINNYTKSSVGTSHLYSEAKVHGFRNPAAGFPVLG